MDRALQLEELSLTHSYEVFSSLIRTYDARRWLSTELNISDKDVINAIIALDRLQIKVHPEKIEDVERHSKGKLRLVTSFILRKLAKPYPRALAKKIFAQRETKVELEEVPCVCRENFSNNGIPEKWKIDLPIPPKKISFSVMSPTRIDSYRQCPFTFYLRDKNVLGTRADYTTTKLTSSDFGNAAHRVLQAWGNSPCNDSLDSAEIFESLSKYIDEDFRTIFGEILPSQIDVQKKSLRERLGYFAIRQAKWRSDGWVVKAAEQKLSAQYAGVLFEGKCDRIDYNELTHQWCIIDYKTWAPETKAAVNAKSESEGFRLQLPIYCAMLAKQSEGEFAGASLENTKACYALIGKTLESTFFSTPFIDSTIASETEKITIRLLSQLERGVFWPPSKIGEWKQDFGRWVGVDPFQTISMSWIKDQEQRANF
ncbi:MAG: PD-(D/E)XK nuclease family protein [Kiritimatiellae bacterium]|nr:PD-(D/E)XK nuclease family protein [Kiritimatiellia bacterium]